MLFPAVVGIAHAHTIDLVGDGKYRIEIGWMYEPVVSGETNGIEIYVSPMNPCPDIPDAIKCAESHEFKNGVTGLEETLKLNLLYKGEKIILSLKADHNIPGRYYTFVNPTVSGYYQANVLGNIEGTPISLSMHPPKVDERSYIEFPKQEEHEEIIEEHNVIQEKHSELETAIDKFQSQYDDLQSKIDSIENKLEEPQQSEEFEFGYVGIAIATGALVLGIVAVRKR